MAYTTDITGDIIINGFEQGIANDPYTGISDIRNANLISVPGEASVNFSTSKISAANASGTMTNTSASGDTVTLSTNIESGQAIQFSVLSDATKGIALNTTYWAVGSGGVYQLYSDYARVSLINITGDGVTGTWATVNMGSPKYFAYDSGNLTYWMVDANGLVWSNANTTNNSPFYWTYTGNQANNNSHGNGLAYYRASDGTGYIFVFSDGSIDFTPSASASVSWSYQWNWTAGTIGSYNANPTNRLKNNTSSVIHETLTAPDNVVYFCDGSWIGRWYENTSTSTGLPTVFLPSDITTYTADETRLLPWIDTAQALAFLGTNVMIGGKLNVIYPWDTTSPTFSYPILLAEYNTVRMVTVNTNMFIFVGNRGRIYYTNGTNAQLYKKIPDHISGTVEPYFTWGGATSTKNQLYFSFSCTTNGGVANTQYGGVWAVDLDSQALRMTNTLSYQTSAYNGYATAIIPNFGSSPSGTGLYIGWNTGSSSYGIDTTASTPYSGSQTVAKAIVVSDLIPIGTFDKPTDFERVEYKLTKPMVSGESIAIFVRLIFNTTDTGFGTALLTDTTTGNFSNSAPVNFKNAQWLQVACFYYSTSNSPSYTRLKEFRIKRTNR